MRAKPLCPICEAELRCTIEMCTEGVVGEETKYCPNKHYCYEFSYGHYYWQIGPFELYESYNDSPVKGLQDRRRRQRAIYVAKLLDVPRKMRVRLAQLISAMRSR